MKLKQFIIPLLLLSLWLTGCARNNVNNDNVAYRTNNGTQPARVDTRRPAAPGVTDTNPNVTDVRDNVNNNLVDVRDNNGNLVGVRDNNNRNFNDNVNQRSRMRVADKAADKIANLAEVDTANVIATENNAYVAVKLANGANLSNRLEGKISKAVKTTDRDIDRVYVSANPDFYKHMTNYGNDIRSGRPVTGFFDQFSRMVQRTFPDVK